MTNVVLNKGDLVSVYTPGAGGYGPPKERDRERVLVDVIEGRVSPESAKEIYGVDVKVEAQTCTG